MAKSDRERLNRIGGLERLCLEAIIDGESEEEIASRLGIKPLTVSKCLDRAVVHLGARNRMHAVAVAFREGVIEARDPGPDLIAAASSPHP